MLQHEVSVLKLLNKNKITDIVRKYFTLDVSSSLEDQRYTFTILDNERFLEPHQETNQFTEIFFYFGLQYMMPI